MRRLAPLLLAALPALAPAAEELPIPGQLPPAVRRLFERELPKLAARDWAVPGRVSGKVEAAAAPTVTNGDPLAAVSIPIGTALPVSCSIARGRMDAGGWITGVLGEVAKGVKIAAVHPVDLVVVAGSPLLFVDALYLKEAKEGKQVGMLKLAVYAHDAHMFLCLHDEPGYRKTFRRVVGGFAEAMRGGEDPRAKARYAEVAAMRIGGMPVGFSETVYLPSHGGGTSVRSVSAMLLPRTAAELSTMDVFAQEEVDGKDLVAYGVYVEAANGEVSHKLQLARAQDGKAYSVEGSKAGKALKGTFPAPDGLAADLWFARRLAAKGAPVSELSHDVYRPSGDPLRASAMTVRRAKGGGRKVEVSSDGMTYTAELDDAGQQVKAQLPIGPVTVSVERLWKRGTP